MEQIGSWNKQVRRMHIAELTSFISANKTHGNIVTYKELAEAIQLQHPTSRLTRGKIQSLMNGDEGVKAILIKEKGYHLETSNGEGYKIIEPGYEVEHYKKEQERNIRRVANTAVKVSYIRSDRIQDDCLRSETIEFQNKMRTLSGLRQLSE